ncbi:MAG: 2-hydroxyglutaryl-CoA dehydratase, partial [Clostridia bacterium]|nr:2-hydroxyglutaryl-CoA dehydratase [Clostridia bacterium]
MRIGLDIGSTTIKAVVLNDAGELVFRRYERHRAQIAMLSEVLLHAIMTRFPGEVFQLGISGSAGMGMAEELDIDFLQEVYATRVALRKLAPKADVAIELGGEDAKILFLTGAGGLEVRMNGTCAGGTGAFIDQMATLMDVPVERLDALSRDHQRSYAIASRCGVFAKSDIQPLLNQGARKEDVARSIFEAVAGQTIAGLAQGREIAGNVVYLGGPLTFFSELRDCFDKALNIRGVHPADALYSGSIGAALQARRTVDIQALIPRINSRAAQARYVSCPP